ncbi:MAG: hypothetical protein U0905_12375 [Pirellulales bacterium]
MTTLPDRDTFRTFAETYDYVPVYRRLLSDALTPVTAFRLLDEPLACSCLFESVIGGEKVGRYSMIAVHPRMRMTAHGQRGHLSRSIVQRRLRHRILLKLWNAK